MNLGLNSAVDPFAGVIASMDIGAPDDNSTPFDKLSAEFESKFKRTLPKTAADNAEHIQLHGKGNAWDVGVRTLAPEQRQFILSRAPQLGLNVSDYSQAQPHTTSTGVKITGPHLHLDTDAPKNDPFAKAIQSVTQSDPFANAIHDTLGQKVTAEPAQQAPPQTPPTEEPPIRLSVTQKADEPVAPQFAGETMSPERLANFAKNNYQALESVPGIDIHQALTSGKISKEEALQQLHDRMEQMLADKYGVPVEELKGSITSLGDPEKVLSNLKAYSEAPDTNGHYLFALPGGVPLALEQTRRIDSYKNLSPEQKEAEAWRLGQERPLSDRERQALGVGQSFGSQVLRASELPVGVLNRFFTGSSKDIGEAISGAGRVMGSKTVEDFGKKGQEAAKAFGNVYGQQGTLGNLAEMGGHLAPEITASVGLPESKIAHALYWYTVGSGTALGRGATPKEAANQGAQMVAMLGLGKIAGPLAEESSGILEGLTKLGARAGQGAVIGYGLAKAGGASDEQAREQALLFGVMHGSGGGQKVDKPLQLAERPLNSLSEARDVIAGHKMTPDELANTGHDLTPQARELQKAAIDKSIADPNVKRIVIVAGAPGDGKTTFVHAQEAEPGTVYKETHLEDLAEDKRIIDAAKAAGKDVEVVGVMRKGGPVESYKKVVERADDTGKIVTPEYGADLTRSFYGNFPEIAAYAKEQGVPVRGTTLEGDQTYSITGKMKMPELPEDLEDQFREIAKGSKYADQFLSQGRPGDVRLESPVREAGEESAQVPSPKPEAAEEAPETGRKGAEEAAARLKQKYGQKPQEAPEPVSLSPVSAAPEAPKVEGTKAGPAEKNFTQFANEQGKPSDYDITEHGLLGESGTMSKRTKQDQMNRMSERIAANQQAHRDYEAAIRAGEIVDSDGKITKEGLEAADKKASDTELQRKIANIDNHIQTIENLGPMSHLPNGKLKAKYQRTVDEYNRQKAALAEPPKLAVEPAKQPWQMTREQTVANLPANLRAEVLADQGGEFLTGEGAHHASVRRALEEGKPVPPEVLADYPDLAAKYAPEPAAHPSGETVTATSPESEVRLNLRAGQGPELTAKVVFRPVGSNQAVVEIKGQRFTIDNSRRLVDAGVRLDSSEKQSTLKGKTQRDVNAFFAQYPKLTVEDFPLARPEGGETVTEPSKGISDIEERWNREHSDISYQRALELEGRSDYPRQATAIFHFDDLTPEEQQRTITTKIQELDEAKANTKRQYQLGKQSVQTLKGTDFAGRGMDEHKAALKSERRLAAQVESLKSRAKPIDVQGTNVEPPSTETAPEGYGAKNKAVTKEAADTALENFKQRQKTQRGSGGLSTEDWKDLATVAAYHIEAGGREFADFSKRMVDHLGDWVEPYLKDLHDQVMGTLHHSELQPRTEEGKFDGPPEGYTPKEDRLPETTGIARRVEEARRGESPERGKAIGAEESVESGRDMLRRGENPQTVIDAFNETHAVSPKGMALVRARHEELAQAAHVAFDKGGQDFSNPEYKAAEKARQDFWERSVHPMEVAWSNTGRAMQGETAIDTGTFYGVAQKFKQETGREMRPHEQEKAKTLASKEATITTSLETAEKELIDRLNRAAGIKDLDPDMQKALDRFVQDSRREARTQKRQATKKTLDEEAAVIKSNLAAAFKKVTQNIGTSPSGLAGIDPEGEITKYVIQYAKNRVKAGIVDASQLIDDVHGAIKEFADVSRREVAETLAGLGVKGEKREPSDWMKTKGEIRKGVKAENVAAQLADVGKRIAAGERAKPEDVKTIWRYANEKYIDKGVNIADTIQKLATEFDATPDQIRTALGSRSGVTPMLNTVYRKMALRRQARQATEQWIREIDQGPWMKAVQGTANTFFNIKTLGHGTVGPVTHAGENIFHPTRWVNYFKNVGRTWKAAYSSAAHEKYMQDLVNDPNYWIARQGGLKNEPGKFYDEYQNNLAQKMFGEIGKIGNRGFDILKTMRQDFFNQRWNKLDESQQTPEMAKEISRLVNHATGAVEKNFSSPVTRAVFFAAPLEASRWARILGDPVRAVDIFMKGKKATDAERYFAKSVVKNHAEFLATYLGALALNQAVLKATGSDDKVNFTDPSKGDWMRMKIKGRAIEPTGGLISTIDFLGRLGNAMVGEQDPRKTRKERIGGALVDYGRGKLSPFASTIADFATQADYSGRPMPFSSDRGQAGKPRLSWPEYFGLQQTPIPVAEASKDFLDEMHKQGVPASTVNEIFRAAISHPGATGKALGIGVTSGGTGVRVGTEYEPDHKAIAPTFRDGDEIVRVPTSEFYKAQSQTDAKVRDGLAQFRADGRFRNLSGPAQKWATEQLKDYIAGKEMAALKNSLRPQSEHRYDWRTEGQKPLKQLIDTAFEKAKEKFEVKKAASR